MAKAKIIREAVETSAEFARKAYDEVLDFFGYGADADEIMSEVGNLSPQTRNVLKALERDDFLGFETPDQALKQFIENPVYTYENYDISPQLKSALTKFSNNPPNKPSKTMADVGPEYTGPNILGSRIAPTAAAGLLGAMALTQSEDAEAGKVKVAKEGADSLLDYMIKAWHGSPSDFDRFDSQYIGTGEGAQAFGYGHYVADRKGLGEHYRDTLTELHGGRVSPEALPDFNDMWMTRMGKKILSEAGGNPQLASKLAYNLSQSAINDDFIGKYKTLSKTFADLPVPDLKGKLYEVGIKAPPESFLDWDKPISQQSDYIKSRLGVIGDPNEIASLQSRKAQLEAEYESIIKSQKPAKDNDFDSLFGNIDPREGQLLQEIQLIGSRINDLTTPKDIRVGQSVIPAKVQDTYLARQIIEGGGKSSELSKELSGLGIRGVKYLDAASRKAGEGSNNYVVFSDDDIDIINKYLRPETAAVGLTQALTNQDIVDLNQQVAIDSGMAQLGYDKDRPESAMYNYSKILPIRRHKDARGLTDGVLFGFEPAMTGILEEVMRGLIDVGESRKTGRVQNPNSIWDALL